MRCSVLPEDCDLQSDVLQCVAGRLQVRSDVLQCVAVCCSNLILTLSLGWVNSLVSINSVDEKRLEQSNVCIRSVE